MKDIDKKILFYKIKRGEIPHYLSFLFNPDFKDISKYRSFLYIISIFFEDNKNDNWIKENIINIQSIFRMFITKHKNKYISCFLASVIGLDIEYLSDYSKVTGASLPKKVKNLYKDILKTFAIDTGSEYLIYDFDGSIVKHCKI